jgi:hypothetical protein
MYCHWLIKIGWGFDGTTQGVALAATQRGGRTGLAHDRRVGHEPWAWLVGISDEDLDREWHRVASHTAVSVHALRVPALQRVGDLVVYCGSTSGALTGIGEIVGEPHRKSDDDPMWRLRVLPRLLLDRDRGPSMDDAGLAGLQALSAGRQRQLEREQYLRLRELMLAVAVRLDATPTTQTEDSPA